MAVVKNKNSRLVKQHQLDKSSWTYKGFHGVLHTFFPVGQVGPAVTTFLSQQPVKTLFFVADNYVHWYWNDNDLTFIREEFFKRLEKDKHYLKKLQAAWQEKIKKFETVIAKIERTDLTKLSDQALIQSYSDFYKAYTAEFKYFMVLGDAISMPADRYLVPEFKKILGADFLEVFPKLLTTKYLSFIEEEAGARKKLLADFISQGKIAPAKLARHATRFFYISNNYARGVKLSAADFLELIRKDSKNKLVAAPTALAKSLALKQKLIKKYQLAARPKMFLYVMDELFKIQDTRKKYVLISNFYQFEFLKEISRRTRLPFKLLQYSIFPEIADLLAGKIPAAVLAARAAGCACLHTAKGFTLVTGQEYQKLFNYFQTGCESQKELKGLVASLGKARGQVKKILKIHDMANMEKGDILVSSMTRPEMVPVMKLAAAIITDEGGVTSHAAIISRELKIPCIIGVKIATQVLQDGDEVEVDANQGVIRILKRK